MTRLSPSARTAARSPFLLAVGALAAATLLTLLPRVAPAADAEPASFPSVDHPGRNVVRYDDGKLRIVVGYRHAAENHGRRWIGFDLGASGPGGQVMIHREHLSLVGPDGTRVPLATQRELATELRPFERIRTEMNVAGDPIDGYFSGPQRRDPIEFFKDPSGPGVVLDQFAVDQMTYALGRIWFRSPTEGFAAGLWVLEIRSRELDVRIPIELVTDAERKTR